MLIDAGAPLISTMMSIPCLLALVNHPTVSPEAASDGLKIASAPISEAKDNLYSFVSVATTLDAPAAFNIAIENNPIGPQPSTATVLSFGLCANDARTAPPNASCKAAMLTGILDWFVCHKIFSGTEI